MKIRKLTNVEKEFFGLRLASELRRACVDAGAACPIAIRNVRIAEDVDGFTVRTTYTDRERLRDYQIHTTTYLVARAKTLRFIRNKIREYAR